MERSGDKEAKEVQTTKGIKLTHLHLNFEIAMIESKVML